MMTISVIIDRVEQATPEIKVFHLSPKSGASLPAFSAGSHVDVFLPGGIVRPYSLCSNPADGAGYAIAVKRENPSRGGSTLMHEQLAGSELTISQPRNNFPLMNGEGPSLLFAGGIGVTPMLSMLWTLTQSNSDCHLHYFTRSAADTAFLSLLSRPEFASRVTLHQGLDVAQVQQVSRELLRERPATGQLYICGPRAFMDMVQASAATTWPEEAVHLEHFSGDASLQVGAGKSFIVRLARTGGEFVVDEGKSMVEALAEHEVYIDTSCEQGVCGTCVVDVLDGIPDHRDEILTAAERASCKKMIACVSRSKSQTLVIDF